MTKNMTVINRYKQNGSAEKMRGAVYTPPRVAATLAQWAIRSRNDSVLDPSCGDGVFLAAARTRLADLGNPQPICLGVDIDPQAASAADAICDDFFAWVQSARSFDAIVGNPPFIRSHLFSERSRALAFEQMKYMGLHPSRLMSTWAPFVALSCKLLTENGRLALVVPEELLHVSYAAELRRFLLSRFRRVMVCLPDANLFPSVQQAVVLLLCDNCVGDPSGLLSITTTQLESGNLSLSDAAPLWSWSTKWTHLFVSQSERHAVSAAFHQLSWKPLKEYGRVEVGVVTGHNDFFILSQKEANLIGGEDFVTPILTNARDLQGIKLDTQDFRTLTQKERPAFLIDTSAPLEQLPTPLRHYLEHGIKQAVNQRFKCRNREPWYAVPSVWPADALLLRQAGDLPKLVHLTMKCASTDTIHRVRWKRPSLGKLHVVGFLNTWTLLACELLGRSYGGGVLELMPSEANNIPMPAPHTDLGNAFDATDASVRLRQFDAAIELVDEILKPADITRAEYSDTRNILAKLIARRKNKQNGSH